MILRHSSLSQVRESTSPWSSSRWHSRFWFLLVFQVPLEVSRYLIPSSPVPHSPTQAPIGPCFVYSIVTIALQYNKSIHCCYFQQALENWKWPPSCFPSICLWMTCWPNCYLYFLSLCNWNKLRILVFFFSSVVRPWIKVFLFSSS